MDSSCYEAIRQVPSELIASPKRSEAVWRVSIATVQLISLWEPSNVAGTTTVVSACLYWSWKSILMAARTAFRGVQRLQCPLFSFCTSSFLPVLSFLMAWSRLRCPHYSEPTPVSFIWLTGMREDRRSMGARGPRRQIKKSFQEPENLLGWCEIGWDQREKVRCQRVTFIVDGGFAVRLWGWIYPSFAHFKPRLLFLISLEAEGDYILIPTPKHTLCNPLIGGAALTIFLPNFSLVLSICESSHTVTWL